MKTKAYIKFAADIEKIEDELKILDPTNSIEQQKITTLKMRLDILMHKIEQHKDKEDVPIEHQIRSTIHGMFWKHLTLDQTWDTIISKFKDEKVHADILYCVVKEEYEKRFKVMFRWKREKSGDYKLVYDEYEYLISHSINGLWCSREYYFQESRLVDAKLQVNQEIHRSHGMKKVIEDDEIEKKEIVKSEKKKPNHLKLV